MNTTTFNPVVVLGVDPIHVVSPAIDSATSLPSTGSFPWMVAIGIVIGIAMVVALGALLIGGITAFKRIRALNPEEQAFRSVCKLMRIPPTIWPEIRALARRIEAEPVAILISKTAFDRAMGGSGHRSSDASPELNSARARLFGDDHAS